MIFFILVRVDGCVYSSTSRPFNIRVFRTIEILKQIKNKEKKFDQLKFFYLESFQLKISLRCIHIELCFRKRLLYIGIRL